MLFGFKAGAAEHAAQATLSGGAALFAGDIALAINDYVDGIDLRVVHGGEVRVFGEHDGDCARVVDEILFHPLIWFEDVDGEHDQILALVFLGNVIDQLGFLFAVLAPCGPEFEEYDFALDGVVIELISGGGFRAEAGSGLAGFIALSDGDGGAGDDCQDDRGESGAAHDGGNGTTGERESKPRNHKGHEGSRREDLLRVRCGLRGYLLFFVGFGLSVLAYE